MSRAEELHIWWTAALIDPNHTVPVGDGSGLTPDEAYDRMVEHLRWKANQEHAKAGRVEAALETALRDGPVQTSRRAEAS